LHGPIVWLIALIALFFLFATFLKTARTRAPTGRWPLHARTLLGNQEQVFYWRLVKAFPNHVILSQVALSQLLGIDKGTPQRQAFRNRFRQLCADFVICTKSFSPVAVIELDGVSHDQPRRQDADTRKAHALESARIPLHRINVKMLPDEAELRQRLALP
jgi:hypothetical protein